MPEIKKNFTHAELVELGMKWLVRREIPVVISEMASGISEQPDVLGFSWNKSILIECKTSRADFHADRSKPHRGCPGFGVGPQRWFLAPQGLIKKEELPPKWGLLEVTDRGKIKTALVAIDQERNFHAEQVILLSLLRRLNIQPEGHVAIKKYVIMSEKNRAMFFIEKAFSFFGKNGRGN